MVPSLGPVGFTLISVRCPLTRDSFSKPLTWLGNTVYGLATKFHLIPLGASDVESAGYTQLPGGARAEAERRR